MVWLPRIDDFDPDRLGMPVVGITATLGDHHDDGLHQHAMGQLLFAQQGCIRITLAGQLCLLPPTRAAWIPPTVVHRALMRQTVDYCSIYLDVSQFEGLPQTIEVIDVTPLLRALLERIALADFATCWEQGYYAHLLALCIEEIRQARREPLLLPLPLDRRLAVLREAPDQLPPQLQQLVTEVGASGKTINRIFQRETGMSYQQWRQQWRLLKAIEMLAVKTRLSNTASLLGFASDSAFIAFFKDMTGQTPRAYFRRGIEGIGDRPRLNSPVDDI